VIDLGEQPALAVDRNILAVPTLVKQRPPPAGRLIGDLSDTGMVLAVLGLEAS
jgi:circadian clock protein KaiB